MEKSRRTQASGDLVPNVERDVAKELLVALANLPDESSAIAEFVLRFRTTWVAKVPIWLLRNRAMNWEQDYYDPSLSEGNLMLRYFLMPLRDAVRNVWRAPNLRAKRWVISRISQDFFQYGYPDLLQGFQVSHVDDFLSPGPPSPIDLMLERLVQSPRAMRFCSNVDCQHPYFFSIRSQQYCNRECSKPAQREAKKRDWKRRKAVALGATELEN